MTQDEIIALLHKVIAKNQNFTTWTVSTPHLIALVNQAVEAEREACAKAIDEMHLYGFKDVREFEIATLQDAARAIRARGTEA